MLSCNACSNERERTAREGRKELLRTSTYLLTESSAKADDTTISPVALELAALRMDIELLASQERS